MRFERVDLYDLCFDGALAVVAVTVGLSAPVRELVDFFGKKIAALLEHIRAAIGDSRRNSGTAQSRSACGLCN